MSLREQVIEEACSAFRLALEERYADIAKDALDMFRADEDAGEPKAKVAFAVAWNPQGPRTKITTKLSWSVTRSEEAEIEIDSDQERLPLGDWKLKEEAK